MKMADMVGLLTVRIISETTSIMTLCLSCLCVQINVRNKTDFNSFQPPGASCPASRLTHPYSRLPITVFFNASGRSSSAVIQKDHHLAGFPSIPLISADS